MSSPRKSCGPNEIREGTRFVLKEITASLHNSPVKQTSPRKSGNDSSLQKSPEHAVKVQFAREFADVKKTGATESLSSAGSFQSLSSTLSSKSSSGGGGICADLLSESPGKSANTSYVNCDISGLDDLISACAGIKINENGSSGIGDLSQDQTFASACGDLSITDEINVEENEVNSSFTQNNTFNEENNRKNETEVKFFNCSTSDPPEDFLPPLEQFPIQSLSSNVPFVSFDESITKTHGLQNINSLVFSTAPDLQNLAGFFPKIVDVKSITELNVSENEHANSITECGFNASIESQKNVSVIESKKDVSASETTQLPSNPIISNLTLSIDSESVENENVASTQLESIPIIIAEESLNSSDSVKIIQGIQVNLENEKAASPQLESIPITIAEESPNSSASVKIIQEIQINVDQAEIRNDGQESANVAEQIPDNSQDVALNSTFEIIHDKNLEEKPDLKSPIAEFVSDKIDVTPNPISDFLDHSPSDENINISNPEKKTSPTLQSILDKVAEQQKALDDFAEPPNNLEFEKSPECKRNFNLSTIIESSPDSITTPSPPPPVSQVFNNTIVLSTEKPQKAPEEIDKCSSSLEKLSETNNDTVDSSSEIVFLKRTSLESTVITVNGNQENSGKVETPLADEKVVNTEQLNNSVNIPEKKEESPVKILEKKSEFELAQIETPKRPTEKNKLIVTSKKIEENIKKIEIEKSLLDETSVPVELDSTVILENSEFDIEAPNIVASVPQEENYENFKPRKQSTDLADLAHFSLQDKVELEAQAVAQEIYNKSLEIVDENEQFISATSELFQDPTSFDFLLSQGSSTTKSRDLRFESLYVKFDPLVNNSMLPQGNSQTEDEEQNEKNESPSVPSADTPMRNPAIAAIDRLLFYSPMTPVNKTEATKDTKQEASETAPQEVPVVDEKMAKELEHVRSLVVELEKKLEKSEKERENTKKDLKKQQEECRKAEEKIIKLEAQLAQELESKKEVSLILDEYEKSISRMVAERERNRTELEERERLKEELQAATLHLNNTEAAFNDVHQKYERAKNVVAAYKSNEVVLKESHKENQEIIAKLEKKYDTLKSHAMAQLEKANQELETIQKHHEAEKVKFLAIEKKAELKIKSLTDLVEQKTVENKELSKILDEVIARVGNKNHD